jgi:hypothetical protein
MVASRVVRGLLPFALISSARSYCTPSASLLKLRCGAYLEGISADVPLCAHSPIRPAQHSGGRHRRQLAKPNLLTDTTCTLA